MYIYSIALLKIMTSFEQSFVQRISRNIIGITSERALRQYNIPNIDQKCVAVTERILNDPHHTLTVALEKKKSPHNTQNEHQKIS